MTSLDRQLQDADTKLHEAFYYYGTKNELIQMSLIKRAGMFSWEVDENADLSGLTKIDSRSFASLDIPSESIEFFSEHPSSAYRIVKKEAGKSTLYIDDGQRFWELSRVLIMRIE